MKSSENVTDRTDIHRRGLATVQAADAAGPQARAAAAEKTG